MINPGIIFYLAIAIATVHGTFRIVWFYPCTCNHFEKAQGRPKFPVPIENESNQQPAIIQATVAKTLSPKILELEHQKPGSVSIIVPSLSLPLPGNSLTC